MLKNRFLTSFTAIFVLCGMRAQAENAPLQMQLTRELESATAEGGIVIEGDKVELFLDRKMRSIGNASIHRDTQDVYGDVIEYDVQNDALHVEGNAKIDLGDATITGPEIRMQLSESVGEMRDASVTIKEPPPIMQTDAVDSETFSKRLGNLQSQQVGDGSSFDSEIQNTDLGIATDSSNTQKINASSVRADAKSVLFEGPNRKRLKNARFTTCEVGVDDWYIKAKEIELNDYSDSGTAKSAYVEFKGVPLLYTPWIGFSYNNQRKSGLLAPTIGSTSRSGFEVSVPFYWNISPNMDATLGTRALSKRGVQFQGEFRYLEENFSGIDSLEYLPSDSLFGGDRYYANLKHQHELGSGWSAGYSLEKVSDNEYFSELSTRIVTTSRINLPQQFNLSYSSDVWRFNALAQKFQTLDDASYPYERLPQMTLVGDKYFGNLNTNLYTQLVQFDRNNSGPTVSPTTNLPIPTGSRFTAYPSISYPMNLTYGYITPKVGVHHTNYSLNNTASNLDSQQRTIPITSVDSGLFFDRDFKVADRKYLQTLEPRFFYVYIPKKDQSDIPIFDTNEVDLNFSSLFNENQFTGNDRVNDANQASVALTTRLIDAETGVQRLSASIGQRYYFSDQQTALPNATLRDSNSSDLLAGFSANLRNAWNIDALWQYNTDASQAVRTTLTSRYNPEPGKTLNLSYSYRRNVLNQVNSGIDQFNISGQWPLGKGWYGIGRVNYSLQDNQLIETLAGLEYNAGCWQTRSVIQRVTTATADANYALFFQLELGGLASIGANPLSVIKRNIPGYVSSGLIPDSAEQAYYE